eukprot:gnl/TRDRNA2_/TRDRNA2_179111_c0_seq1.p1 gnl/TRDRNA2_/TRDRNA2_179111_c0~~gnl/TRDRNA2_/TRDRNA2_179111_c0_seq1.p1  ORF type:complete len:205 (+),score=33.02 gnl/TRDRNA2_/TRDRNA2_179111_c0_seq1:68-616(+)
MAPATRSPSIQRFVDGFHRVFDGFPPEYWVLCSIFIGKLLSDSGETGGFIARLLVGFSAATAVDRHLAAAFKNLRDTSAESTRRRSFSKPAFASLEIVGSDDWAGTCSICLECEGGPACRAACCGSHYHEPCIQQWLRRAATCPQCRSGLRSHKAEEGPTTLQVAAVASTIVAGAMLLSACM